MENTTTLRTLQLLVATLATLFTHAQAPVADFTWSFVQTGNKVQFVDASTGNPTQWIWQFGDGAGSVLQNPMYIYSSYNIYNVCLSVSNSFGTSAQVCNPVHITGDSWPFNPRNIKGNVYLDNNSNCVNDTVTDIGLSNITINIMNNTGNLSNSVSYNNKGNYGFTTSYDTFYVSVDTAALPFEVMCPVTNEHTAIITAADSVEDNLNFGLRCKSGYDLKAQAIHGTFVPANSTLVSVFAGDVSNFFNAHCAAGVSGSVVLAYSGPVQFVSAANGALTPMVTGNTLTWNVADFGVVDFINDFKIVMRTDTTAQIGQQVCFTLTVNPIAGDYNPSNNELTKCFRVVASYDPNDKTAYPAGNIDTAQKELTYTIRFQNTGTAQAQHIYITDTLDSDIQPSSVQLLAYSHQPMMLVEGNALRFNFQNIKLPDINTNEPLSHGYVQYKVKLKPNLPVGTVINNTAYIYFDFNAPVVTNTTTNTISLVSSIGHSPLATAHFTIFPNPSNGNVTLSIPESLIGSTATISDITGRVVSTVPLTTAHCLLPTANFLSGIYFVTVGGSTQKLIVTK